MIVNRKQISILPQYANSVWLESLKEIYFWSPVRIQLKIRLALFIPRLYEISNEADEEPLRLHGWRYLMHTDTKHDTRTSIIFRAKVPFLIKLNLNKVNSATSAALMHDKKCLHT